MQKPIRHTPQSVHTTGLRPSTAPPPPPPRLPITAAPKASVESPPATQAVGNAASDAANRGCSRGRSEYNATQDNSPRTRVRAKGRKLNLKVANTQAGYSLHRKECRAHWRERCPVWRQWKQEASCSPPAPAPAPVNPAVAVAPPPAPPCLFGLIGKAAEASEV